MDGKPTFETAVGQFQKLLRKCDFADRILWLMPENILVSGKRFVYVKFPLPGDNEERTRQRYDEGIAQGRGVLITTLCEMAGSTCCLVWFPKDANEKPQGIWPQDGSVKMSASTGVARISGKAVRSRLL